jgi:hypothetical protein
MTIMKNVMKNLRTVAMVTALISGLAVTAPAFANEGNNPAIELKFIGHAKDQLVFQLEFKNAEEDEYIINITDKDGYTIYTEKTKGINITRKLIFNKDELGDDVLRVKVRSKKTNRVETYEINRSSRVVEETIINKLK